MATDRLHVAFLGLGFMGTGMAANLARALDDAGVPLLRRLTVWNRTMAKGLELVTRLRAEADAKGTAVADMDVAETAAQAVADADVVCVCLASEAAGAEVLGVSTSSDGDGAAARESSVVARAKADAVVIDHSTVSPAFTAASHAAFASAGVSFIDGPISGGPEGAAGGTLAIMCGGDAAAFDKCKPALDVMGATVMLLGPAGSGTAAKLANQVLVGMHAIAAGEALALAKHLGVTNFKPLLALLDKSYGNSTILQRVGAIVASAEESGEGQAHPTVSASGAPLRLLAKDLGFVRAGADGGAGPDMPMAAMATALFRGMRDTGHSEADMATAYYLSEHRKLAALADPDATAGAGASGSAHSASGKA